MRGRNSRRVLSPEILVRCAHALPSAGRVWDSRFKGKVNLPASEKRLAPLRGFRGAALPGHTLVVYDPDSALVCDIVACEDAYESERVAAAELIAQARPRQAWIGDRHFCTEAILQGLHERGAGFIVREHARHPKLMGPGPWSAYAAIETGRVRQQSIELANGDGQTQSAPWRRIEIELNTPTEAGDKTIALWSNLPEEIDAANCSQLGLL